jgi:hypothetical protein
MPVAYPLALSTVRGWLPGLHVVDPTVPTHTTHPTEPPQAKSEPEWHLNFPRYYEEMVRAAVASKEAALGSAEAGLKWLYGKFEFIKEGHTKSLAAAQVHSV